MLVLLEHPRQHKRHQKRHQKRHPLVSHNTTSQEKQLQTQKREEHYIYSMSIVQPWEGKESFHINSEKDRDGENQKKEFALEKFHCFYVFRSSWTLSFISSCPFTDLPVGTEAIGSLPKKQLRRHQGCVHLKKCELNLWSGSKQACTTLSTLNVIQRAMAQKDHI